VPVLAVALTPQSRGGLLQGERATVPLYAFPEDAVRALEHAWRYAEWRARPRGAQPVFDDLRPDVAAGVIAGALAAGESWLSPERAELLLASYGIAVVESRRVSSAAAAGRAARELGGRVALKAVARDVLHKSEAGAVRLSLEGITETTKAARAMQRKLRDAGHAVEGFVVQRMADPAPEVLVGVASDEVFGPVVVCAAGGTAVELLGDTAARITPLTDLDAHDLLRSLKTFPLLDGWRGAPRSAVADLEQMLLRISALVEAHAAIVELDLNPVVVGPDGALAVDHRVRVAQPPRPRPWPSIGTGPAPARQG
jgi:acyl-CoA synthetase (NDP forming)